MLSISQFRSNLFSVFKLMENTGDSFEVVHKGKVYLVSVRHIPGAKPKTNRPKFARKQVLPQSVEVEACEQCGNIRLSGICMNRDCSTNK